MGPLFLEAKEKTGRIYISAKLRKTRDENTRFQGRG
jgi:hypothetical protein